MNGSFEESPRRQARTGRGGGCLVLFALEPRSYAQAIGSAIFHLRPEVDVRSVEPDELPAEVERRAPVLVFCGEPRPDGCDAAVRWAQFRPYEDPDTVRVDGVPLRFPGLGLEDLLGLVDRFCGAATEAAG